MRLIESHTLTGAATNILFVADLTQYTDCKVIIKCALLCVALNGSDARFSVAYKTGGVWGTLTGSANSQQHRAIGTSRTAATGFSGFGIMFDTVSTKAASNPLRAEIHISRLGTGINRTNFFKFGDQLALGGNNRVMESRGIITTPATGVVIQGLGVQSNATNGIGAGSWAALYIK